MIVTEQERIDLYRNKGLWGELRLHDLLYRTAEKHPDRLALVDPANKLALVGSNPQRLRYSEVVNQVDRLAAVLLTFGFGKDDILLVQMPNVFELVLLYMAASKLGVIISPVPVQYKEHELSEVLQVLEPKAIVSVATLKGVGFLDHQVAAVNQIERILPHRPNIFLFGEGEGCINLCEEMENCSELTNLEHYCDSVSISSNDVLTICWTSGTEGTAKGIPRTHNHWLSVGMATYEGNRIEEGESLLNPFPFINMASIGGLFLSWLYCGGKLVLHHPLDLPIFLQQIVDEKISYTLVPPALLNTLLKDEGLLATCDLSSIRAIGSGSSPLDEWMVAGFQDRFGIEVVNHFGSNEGVSLLCGPNETSDPFKRARLFPRNVSILETRLVNPETGVPIHEPGFQGELQIKGPGVFDGYYKDPRKTLSSFTDDNYFRTGDLFEIDSEDPNFYRFVGRCKDLIIRGGVNIAPAELDSLLCSHPDIVEAAVAGYQCDVMGERVAAFAVCKPSCSLELSDVVNFLKEQKIASFKLPEKLVLIESIPRNPLGKVLRNQLN